MIQLLTPNPWQPQISHREYHVDCKQIPYPILGHTEGTKFLEVFTVTNNFVPCIHKAN